VDEHRTTQLYERNGERALFADWEFKVTGLRADGFALRGRRQLENGARPRPAPLSWASGFDGHAQELRECSAALECAFANVERADLGPGLFDDFAFLIDLL
jgi:hypothetical protein